MGREHLWTIMKPRVTFWGPCRIPQRESEHRKEGLTSVPPSMRNDSWQGKWRLAAGGEWDKGNWVNIVRDALGVAGRWTEGPVMLMLLTEVTATKTLADKSCIYIWDIKNWTVSDTYKSLWQTQNKSLKVFEDDTLFPILLQYIVQIFFLP